MRNNKTLTNTRKQPSIPQALEPPFRMLLLQLHTLCRSVVPAEHLSPLLLLLCLQTISEAPANFSADNKEFGGSSAIPGSVLAGGSLARAHSNPWPLWLCCAPRGYPLILTSVIYRFLRPLLRNTFALTKNLWKACLCRFETKLCTIAIVTKLQMNPAFRWDGNPLPCSAWCHPQGSCVYHSHPHTRHSHNPAALDTFYHARKEKLQLEGPPK